MAEFRQVFGAEFRNQEELRIEVGKQKGSIAGRFNVFRYVDKDTKQHVLYIPSIELSAYGETLDKAKDMLGISIEELFMFFRQISREKLQAELSKLGWTKNKLFNKRFSHTAVDVDGNLQYLNAEKNTIERLSLTAA